MDSGNRSEGAELPAAGGPPETGTAAPPPAPAFLPTPYSWRLAVGLGVVLLAGLAFVTREGIGPRGQAAAGVLCFLGVAAACSANLRAVNRRTLAWGFALQLCLALFVTQLDFGYKAFHAAGNVVKQFLQFSSEGAKFIFGELAKPEAMGNVFGANKGFVFAFTA